nr:hypothetical protein [Tanacetum cinerariifolium]
MTNPEEIIDPIIAMNMALALMAKAFKINYSTPTNNNQRISSNPRNRQIAQPGMNMGQDRQMQMVRGNGNQNQIGNGNLVEARTEGNAAGQNGNQIRCYNCRGVEGRGRNQLQAEEYDLMAAAADLDEIEEVNANCILMANLQQASISGTQTDSAPVYDTDRSTEVHENCDNNEIFNMFTQEEQDTSVEQEGETVEQHPINFEETRALYESLYHNLAIEVEKVNSVNRKLKETNADMTTELARYKNQERCFEISQEKYDKLERCYQQSVYQEQCLSKKINALHLSTEETLQLAQEIRDKMKQMNKEIKPANYSKINHLSRVFVPQKALSREELYFPNNSKTANVSKSFLIPNEDLSDDTTVRYTSVEDKVLVPKPPKNYARCAKCRHPVNGPYCQGCALLRERLEEGLVSYFQNFQNTFESSDDSTNVGNAPREPFVVKQDHGVKSSQNPPPIDECCCECGNALDGIFCQQCICKSCGKGAHIGYNYPPKVLIISNPELCNQTMNDELPQTFPGFNPT